MNKLLIFKIYIKTAFDHDTSGSVEAESQFYHRFIEASKFGFGLRYLIGDDKFNDSTHVTFKTLNNLRYFAHYFIRNFSSSYTTC